MKVPFQKFALAFVLVLGIAAVPAQKADAQATLSADLMTAIIAAMSAEGGPDLAALNRILAANPSIAGQIATAAGALQPGLAASIGSQVAAVLSTARISDTAKAQQISAAGLGLARANPQAAVTILTSIASVAPQFAGSAADGIIRGAPEQTVSVTQALSRVEPAGGGTQQASTQAPAPDSSGTTTGLAGGDSDDPKVTP